MNTWDEAKRVKTLAERGLDFADAEQVFLQPKRFTISDARRNYGEPRFITMGMLQDRVVVVVWTPRDGDRRIISMRKANAREVRQFQAGVGRS